METEEKRDYSKQPKITAKGKVRIKELLDERHMSIKDLADKMGANREVVSRAMTDNPTFSVLANIAAALGVEIKDLFYSNDNINGFVEVNGVIHTIKCRQDIVNLLSIIDK